MKKVLIIMFFCIIALSIKVSAYSETGHNNYYSITFDGHQKLLVDMSDREIAGADKKVNKAKFWGWTTYYYVLNKPMQYIGEFVFARSNNTSETIVFSYEVKESVTTKRSYQVSNSISQKVSGGDKTITASLATELESTINVENTVLRSETIDFDVTILPRTKVSLRTVGRGVVSSGCSAYYVFWIRVKKGTWEVVDPIDIFYELYEEPV